MNFRQKILINWIAVGFLTGQAFAVDSKDEARVTQIIRDVKLLPSDAALRAAVVNDRVKENTGVRTGEESRSELTFADLTITRLGANTIFSFNKAGRNVQLESGSILLRVPKDSGGGFIRTNAVTVAVTGTTVIFEGSRGGRSKLVVLEGGAGVVLVKYPGQSQSVRAGQMLDVPAGATALPLPTKADLSQIMKTHSLITDFGALPSRDLIEEAMKQAAPKQSAREPAAREKADREQAAEERAAQKQADREQAAEERAAEKQADRERADREQAAEERAAQEQADREQAAEERAARKQADKERAAKEQADRKRAAEERAAKEKAYKVKAAKDQAPPEKYADDEQSPPQKPTDKEQPPEKQADRERPPP